MSEFNNSGVLGVDLGGTEIKFALFNQSNNQLIQKWKKPTNDGSYIEGVPTFAQTIKQELSNLQEKLTVDQIGLAAPGLPDTSNSFIKFMPGRLHGLENFNWQSFLDQKSPVRVINDGQAALLGEIWQGAAQGTSNAVQYTIGTGVGGAIFCDGRILRGAIGRAGHIGHTSINYKGEGDICGTPGSIEDAIGQVTLKSRSQGSFDTFKDLSKSLINGNSQAIQIWNEMTQALAASIAGVINIIDPEMVLLSGGITESQLPLIDDVEKWLDQYEWRPDNHKVSIKIAHLGQDAGAFGAAYLASHPTVLS